MTGPVFLDTSIQIERLCGPFTRQQHIEQSLHGRDVYLSSTVFREFQNTILAAYRFVVDALRDLPASSFGGHSRLADIIRLINSQPGLFGERQRGRLLFVVAAIADAFPSGSRLSPIDLADYLDDEIRRYREYRFFEVGMGAEFVDVRAQGWYLDPCSCPVATSPLDPARPGAKIMSCNSRSRSCSIRRLVSDHLESLTPLPAVLAVRKPKAAAALSRLLNEDLMATNAIGQSLCWPLGDTIICLEVPDGALIVTTDGDYDALAPALSGTVLKI